MGCVHKHTVVDEGSHVCVNCGDVTGPHLSPTQTSFNHKLGGPMRQRYSRVNRFRKLL